MIDEGGLCLRLTLRMGTIRFASLYFVVASIFVTLLALVLPPIQGPDEGAHFVRADQISRGALLAHRIGQSAAGGVIDLGIMEAIDRFYPIGPDMRARVTRPMYTRIPWGEAGQWSFPNTALYPPFFYLPAASAIVAGKLAGLDVLQTDKLARLFQGGVSVAIATLAIAVADAAGAWLFTLLLLPSSAALMGSLTQDGPLLACAALGASLLLRLRQPGPAGWRAELAVVCAIIALLGASRPPYAALALLVLAASRVPIRARAAACAAIVCLVACWWVFCAVHVFVSVDQSHAANPGAQIRYLLTHSGSIQALVGTTMQASFFHDYAGFFITTFAPGLSYGGPYRACAWYMLALAAGLTIAAGPGPRLRDAASTLVPVGFSILGIFLIQYLTWTPVGAPAVLGVLGRYFLPLAAFLPLALTGGALSGDRRGFAFGMPLWLAAPLVAFPVVSIGLTAQWLILRYYL